MKNQVLILKDMKKTEENIEKLQDYLDYIHIKELKKNDEKVYSLQEVMSEFEIPR